MNKAKKEKSHTLIKDLTKSPGVYLMKNDEGKVIYVGKAANLRARVRSYFSGGDERRQIRFLMRKVADIEVMVTDTEKEALILEDILIKKHKPRYNINLKDDKTFLSLRVNMKSEFPRVEVVRSRQREPGRDVRYFGPYSSAQALRETLALLQKIFPLRTCRDMNFRNRTRPCLSYQIKRCMGPCCGLVGRDRYMSMMEEVILFLEGRDRELVRRFKRRMKEMSDRLEFEEAARLRDCVAMMEKTLERQKVYMEGRGERDVLGLYRKGDEAALYMMFIRDGKVNEGRSFLFSRLEIPDDDLISSFLRRYYGGGRYIPDEVIIPEEIGDRDVMEGWLGDLRGKSVRITVPKRGKKAYITRLSEKNAKNSFRMKKEGEKDQAELLTEVKEKFGLRGVPARMECLDISNIQGVAAVGSMVTFVDGKADKSKYRRFRIKTVIGADDFAMMHEVLLRRLRHGIDEDDLPDLILVDGGKGQLNSAIAVLDELGLTERVDLLAIAKERVVRGKRRVEMVEERVYLPGRKNPVKLREKSGILLLFQRIRDEAHRFAITYHKNLRSKKTFSSSLDDIRGIGPARKKALLRRFGSLKKIRDASPEELQEVRGVTAEIATEIKISLV